MTELSHSNKTMMTEFKTFPARQVWKPPFTWFLNLSFPKKHSDRLSGNVRSEIVSSEEEGDNQGMIMFLLVRNF